MLGQTTKTYSHAFPYDPSYGFDLEGLLKIAPPKPFPEFERFWRETYSLARETESKLEFGGGSEILDGHEIREVSFRTYDGRKIGGWLAVPIEETPVCAVVQSHGYGGRPSPTIESGALPAIRLLYCTRGFDRSKMDDIPGIACEHVLHGIESRERYVLRGCAADIWAAVGALLAHAPEFEGRLHYSGASFGGGIGALAIPWEERVARCHLGVPTFGNHPFRLQVPCCGSGEDVRRYSKAHPGVSEVLRYFDAAIAASYLRIPTLVACALFDPAVPPPGQFSVYNAIPGPKELFVEPAGHFDYPEAEATNAALRERLNRWFST